MAILEHLAYEWGYGTVFALIDAVAMVLLVIGVRDNEAAFVGTRISPLGLRGLLVVENAKINGCCDFIHAQ